MDSSQLYIGFSLPFARDGEAQVADVRRIDRLVRRITETLPVGAKLDDEARVTLRSRQPYARGTVLASVLEDEDAFTDTWQLLLSEAPSGMAGVKLGVGDAEEPLLLLEREPQAIARRRKAKNARQLLFGR